MCILLVYVMFVLPLLQTHFGLARLSIWLKYCVKKVLSRRCIVVWYLLCATRTTGYQPQLDS